MSAPEATRTISVTAANKAALAFVDLFRKAGVTFPLGDAPDEPHSGVVVDAAGRVVFVVDPSRLCWADPDADLIARAIMLLVNGMAKGAAS